MCVGGLGLLSYHIISFPPILYNFPVLTFHCYFSPFHTLTNQLLSAPVNCPLHYIFTTSVWGRLGWEHVNGPNHPLSFHGRLEIRSWTSQALVLNSDQYTTTVAFSWWVLLTSRKQPVLGESLKVSNSYCCPWTSFCLLLTETKAQRLVILFWLPTNNYIGFKK